MTQEEKELLLKDICTRLPYMPKIKVTYQQQGIKGTDEGNVSCDVIEKIVNDLRNGVITDLQIYLRPMSSMTEEEVDNLFHILKINEKNAKEWLKVNDIGIIRLFTEEGKDFYEIAEAIDYLNSIHIDYRELIEKGLALEVPEEIY